jgi:hypothetical protein
MAFEKTYKSQSLWKEMELPLDVIIMPFENGNAKHR